MKIQIFRSTLNRWGSSQYYLAANIDYPEEHKWTTLERQLVERMRVSQDNIELEWDCSYSISGNMFLNRVFIRYENKTICFYISGRFIYDINQVLPLSKQIFEKAQELNVFKLMIVCNQNPKLPENIRKKIKQVINKITNQVLNKGDDIK